MRHRETERHRDLREGREKKSETDRKTQRAWGGGREKQSETERQTEIE